MSQQENSGQVERASVQEGTVLFSPSAEQMQRSCMQQYIIWLQEQRSLSFGDYAALHRWSVTDLAGFWSSIADYFDVKFHDPYTQVLASKRMPQTEWFSGATLNYVEQALRSDSEQVALLVLDEAGGRRQISYRELADSVARAAAGLRRLGVTQGDRVAALLPNVEEAVILFLATASLGAIWSSCAPEFGAQSVLDRLQQIQPKVFCTVDGYRYGGKAFDKRQAVKTIASGLPSVEHVVWVPGLDETTSLPVNNVLRYADLLSEYEALEPVSVSFAHPLWVLYSSGTTGLPKPIVHGHGGILLEHLKALSLHSDLGPEDRFFWFSTTGWMMWNYLVGGLLVGSTVVLFDGSPAFPDLSALWKMAADEGVTYFGASAPYLMACKKAGLKPAEYDLSRLKAVGSTGAPLSVEGFEWVYRDVSTSLALGSVSGGTDVCTAFVLSCPLLPVRAGEIQCSGLGCAVSAFNEQAEPVVDEVGELVVTQPMPSMPVGFWGDADGSRYHESYFATYPGVWRHGDWIKVTRSGGAVIYGRSDSTLNRGGVRMGTSEFYRLVEGLPEIMDSLVVDTGTLEREGKLWLFLVARPGQVLDEGFMQSLKRVLRKELSPRHVPDEIRQVSAVPRTLSGKKLEVPIKRIFNGADLKRAVNRGTMKNPESLDEYLQFAKGG